MPTTDERREAAARLREEAERHAEGFDPMALIGCIGIDVDSEPFFDGWHRYPDLVAFETWNRLADLIEPEKPTCDGCVSWGSLPDMVYWCSGCARSYFDLYMPKEATDAD